MLQEIYQHFQSIFEICFTAQMSSFQEQIMQLRGSTEGSKHMFLPVILCFGSFLKSYKRRKLLSEWEFYKIVDNFQNRQRIDYLRSIVHNLAYQFLREQSLCTFFSYSLRKPFLFKVDLY